MHKGRRLLAGRSPMYGLGHGREGPAGSGRGLASVRCEMLDVIDELDRPASLFIYYAQHNA